MKTLETDFYKEKFSTYFYSNSELQSQMICTILNSKTRHIYMYTVFHVQKKITLPFVTAWTLNCKIIPGNSIYIYNVLKSD